MKLVRMMGMGAVLASSLALSGCLAGDLVNSSLSFAGDVAGAGLALAPAVIGVAGAAAGARTTYTAPSTSTRTSTSTSTISGYSQKGAFDSCASLYAANGDAAGAAKCRANSNSMGSLH